MMARPVVCAGAVLVLLAASPGLARADTTTPAASTEHTIASWQNQRRADRGLPALRGDDRLHRIARAHATDMARAHGVWHQANLADVVPEWRSLGDNVARGTSAEAICDLFLESSAHRANVFDAAFTLYGVGAAYDDDEQLYVAVVFLQPEPAPANVDAPVARRVRARAVGAAVRRPNPVRTFRTRTPTVVNYHDVATESVAMVVALASMSAADNGISATQARTREIG